MARKTLSERKADKLAEHLHKASFETPIGTVAWDKKGDLKSFEFQIYQWHKDGGKSLATK